MCTAVASLSTTTTAASSAAACRRGQRARRPPRYRPGPHPAQPAAPRMRPSRGRKLSDSGMRTPPTPPSRLRTPPGRRVCRRRLALWLRPSGKAALRAQAMKTMRWHCLRTSPSRRQRRAPSAATCRSWRRSWWRRRYSHRLDRRRQPLRRRRQIRRSLRCGTCPGHHCLSWARRPSPGTKPTEGGSRRARRFRGGQRQLTRPPGWRAQSRSSSASQGKGRWGLRSWKRWRSWRTKR
mmetsp:Transcript_22519/g.53444  ORF Transcript_22519/g.53444 Transcript_22519/m.53444 type:complete len:237 (+) Transcript_22519:837-1547(+)